MSAITTHVLDTSIGRPAAGLRVTLARRDADGTWVAIGDGKTDADGRQRTLMPDAGSPPPPGIYRLTFATGAYFGSRGVPAFYPQVIVDFEVTRGEAHYHVPLLLNPFGYSTYRGS